MASSALLMKLLCVGLLGMLAFAPHTEAISCNQVTSYLAPCLGFIGGGAMDPRCCSGIKGLLNMAKTTPDRQAICGCLKDLASRVPGAGAGAGRVVKTCNVNIPYSLSPNTNCASIK